MALKKRSPHQTVHVSVTEELHKKIRATCAEADIPIGTYVRQILVQHFKTPLKLKFEKASA